MPNCPQVEYAKGTFKIENGELKLSGIYTESDYSVKTSPCNHTGVFTRNFEINFCDDDLQLYRAELSSAPENYKSVLLIRE